jgi:hypothetical protein
VRRTARRTGQASRKSAASSRLNQDCFFTFLVIKTPIEN